MWRDLSGDAIAKVKLLLQKFPAIQEFFRTPQAVDWVAREVGKAENRRDYHILIGYLTSPYAYLYARRMNKVFQSLLDLPANQLSQLRKKVVDAKTQQEFESAWLELDLVSLFLRNGFQTEVEPLRRRGGKHPDMKINLLEKEVFVEAKKLQYDAGLSHLWDRVPDIEKDIKNEVFATDVRIYFSLEHPYPGRSDRLEIKRGIHQAVEMLVSGDTWQVARDVMIGNKTVGHISVHRMPLGETEVYVSWSQSIGEDRIKKLAYEIGQRYYPGGQLPDAGWCVLVIDTYKWGYDSTYLATVWQSSQISTRVNCLVLCSRAGDWSQGLTVGTTLHQHPHLPLPKDVFNKLEAIFHRR